MRVVKLAFSITFTAKLRNESTITREDLNTVVIAVCYYDISTLHNGNACWPLQFTVLVPFSTEIEQKSTSRIKYLEKQNKKDQNMLPDFVS